MITTTPTTAITLFLAAAERRSLALLSTVSLTFWILGCGGGGTASPGQDAAADRPSSPGADGGAGRSPAGAGGAGGGGAASVGPQTCVPPPTVDAPVAKLSQTGCVDPTHPMVMAATVVPYEVNSPLWSDGAEKTRGMALPTGAKIHVKDCAAEPAACPYGPADTGKWVFPVGTVLVKNFIFDGKFLETRLFVRFDEKTWVGYGYRWDEAQTDATIVPDDRVTVAFNTGTRSVDWHYPNRLDCMTCHTPDSGFTLGPETAQLNRVVNGVNQIDRIQGLGLLDATLAKPYQPALVAPYASAGGASPPAAGTLEQRARSYMHANCANCHRPGSKFPDLDLRNGVPLKSTNICGVAPVRGDLVPNNLVLDPGKPATSLVWFRMNIVPDPAGGKTDRMPQLASYVIDADGAALMSDWIKSIAACPP